MNVKIEIGIIEIDGERIAGLERPEMTITSHWNWPKLIIIKIPGCEKEITVDGDELHTAITKAQDAR